MPPTATLSISVLDISLTDTPAVILDRQKGR
ncbi:MAG: YbaY family lipoprotein [Pseudomonadota bacterium]|nr:YbaY family lipoprotein [Pseudomonadota bacterium]